MNPKSTTKPNYSKLELAIKNDQDIIFFHRLDFSQYIFFISLIIFLIWFSQYQITVVIEDLPIMGYTLSLIGIIIYSFGPGIMIFIIIWYIYRIYQSNIVINSKEIQFRIKAKIYECLKWQDFLSISKAYNRFYKKIMDVENGKWNIIVIKHKSGKEDTINAKMLKKNKDFSQDNVKEVIFFILNYYFNKLFITH